MRSLKYIALMGILLFMAAGSINAQVAVGVRVGPVVAGVSPATVCAYGYYGYYPYACVPYGYYGPDWFVGGVFIGAGPWYHGYYGRGYHGHTYYGYGRGYGYRAPVHGFVGGDYRGGGYHGGGGFHGGHH
jgi:hypothetical protein